MQSHASNSEGAYRCAAVAVVHLLEYSVICHSANPPGFRTQRKQGIISAKLRIIAQEQGILPSTPEIIAADVFGTNNGVFFSYRWWGRLDPAPIPDKLRVHLSSPFNT